MQEEFDYSALTSIEEGEVPKTYVNPNRAYKAEEYYLTVRLSDLQGATITTLEDDNGKEVKGLFLPFRTSGLTVTPKKNVLLVCKAEMCQLPSQKMTHILTQVVDRDIVAEWRRLGFKQHLLGHMRPCNLKKKK